jgi:MSHA biogenesis protein MshG
MRYAFKAMDTDGSEIEGAVEAADPSEAARAVASRGLAPFSISERPEQDEAHTQGFFAGLSSGGNVTPVEKELFCKQMSALLKSGLPLLRAIDAIAESSPTPRFERMVRLLRKDLDEGLELSVCLARQPETFDDFFCSLVKAGEQTGKMDGAFSRLLRHLEFQRLIKEQTKTALRYPSTLLVFMAIAVVIVNYFVIPPFAKAYDTLGAQLPLVTRLLIDFSAVMTASGPFILAIAAGAVFLTRRWIATEAGRLSWDRMKLSLPIFGPLIRKAALSRFCRSLSISYAAGVPVNQAIGLVGKTAGNAWIVSRLALMRPAIERGENIHAAALATGEFTKVALQMVRLGDEAGSLDDLMGKVADMYQDDVESDLKTMAQRIEPLVLLVMGAFVLVLAFGIFMPIWSLGGAALHK